MKTKHSRGDLIHRAGMQVSSFMFGQHCMGYTVCKCQVSLDLDPKLKSRDLHQNDSRAVAVRQLSNAS